MVFAKTMHTQVMAALLDSYFFCLYLLS